MTDPIEIMARAIGPFTADDQPDEPPLYLASNVATCLARAGYAIVPASGTVAMVAAFWRQKNTGSQEGGPTGPERPDQAAQPAAVEAGRGEPKPEQNNAE